MSLGATSAQAADVFGTATPTAQAASELRDRMTALEKELKELKSQAAAGGGVAAPGSPAALKMTPPPPPLPGLEGLPSRGANKQETLMVEKELTHQVIGQVNGQLVVREGETTFVMSPKEFKVFETERRKRVVRKLSIEAVGDVKLTLPVPPGSGEGEAAAPAPQPANQWGQPAAVSPANGRPAPAPAAPAAKPSESKAPGKK